MPTPQEVDLLTTLCVAVVVVLATGAVLMILSYYLLRPCNKWPGCKSCPKCYQHPHLRPWCDPLASPGDDYNFRVECPTCGFVGPGKTKTPEQAIVQWNETAEKLAESSRQFDSDKSKNL